MAQLKHLLRRLPCKLFGHPPARFPAGLLAGKPHERRRKHLQGCTACQARQQHERRYLERLRGAAVPAASEDLTARLLARTGQLAARRDDDTPGHVPAHLPASLPPAGRRRAPAGRTALRLAAGVGGAMAAGAVLLGGAAYLLGAETQPAAEAAFASAAFAKPLSGPSSAPALSAGSVSGAAWKLSGEPDVAPAGSLSAEQLAALRARGWSCPELHELGYHLVWARGGVASGAEVLELRLTDGRHFATVLEQHHDGTGPAAGADPATAVPVNVLTGHRASEDGFQPAALNPAPADTAPADRSAAELWVNRQAPFRAIVRTPAATFTYISDSPEQQADDGVESLVRSRPAAPPAAHRDGGVSSRLELGLQRMAELLAR